MFVRLETEATYGGPVRFRGPGVTGAGSWRGSARVPPGTEVWVELDVQQELDLDLVERTAAAGFIARVPGETSLVLQGRVEDLEHDGVLSLRVGGGLVLLDTLGTGPLAIVGSHLEVHCEKVDVYPVDH